MVINRKPTTFGQLFNLDDHFWEHVQICPVTSVDYFICVKVVKRISTLHISIGSYCKCPNSVAFHCIIVCTKLIFEESTLVPCRGCWNLCFPCNLPQEPFLPHWVLRMLRFLGLLRFRDLLKQVSVAQSQWSLGAALWADIRQSSEIPITFIGSEGHNSTWIPSDRHPSEYSDIHHYSSSTCCYHLNFFICNILVGLGHSLQLVHNIFLISTPQQWVTTSTVFVNLLKKAL